MRRWADAGQIPVAVTPGGHRRFTVSDIESFVANQRRVRSSTGLERMWAEQALSLTRQEIIIHWDEHWLSGFDEAGREHKRQLGRRLMGLMLQYISLRDETDVLLTKAHAIGPEHAEDAVSQGMPLVEVMQAVLYFRDTLWRSPSVCRNTPKCARKVTYICCSVSTPC